MDAKEPRILALIGQTYSGKSTVADLVCKMDARFQKRSFATELKREYCEKTGVDPKDTGAPRVKELFRMEVVAFSKKIKNAVGWDYYARKLFEKVGPEDFVVIDDLRFVEELSACLQHNAVIYKVHCEPHQRNRRGYFPSAADTDISETELAFLTGYDLQKMTGGRGGTLFNTRDEDYLRQQIRMPLSEHFPQVVGPKYKEMMQGIA